MACEASQIFFALPQKLHTTFLCDLLYLMILCDLANT